MDRREREVVISVTKPGECDIPTLQKQDTSTLRLQKQCGVTNLMELRRSLHHQSGARVDGRKGHCATTTATKSRQFPANATQLC
ncbi:hypothetical protein GFM14_27875 [Rhizobium leguminosarum bv. viciae]|nr:hypothetical protein [Rhizobium leguminosarum bv. viciae]NKK89403.1 hypothetical protein [Rhizobium leguminosarum bv. viciae]